MDTKKDTNTIITQELTEIISASILEDVSVVITPTSHHEGHVTVSVFNVRIQDAAGNELGNFPLEIAYPKNQDAIDTILYYQKDDQIFICTDTNLRPVLAARPQLGAQDPKQYALAEGVYTIFDTEAGDISFEDAIRRSLHHKLGYEVEQINLQLGSSYFPSIGGNAEVAMSCYIDITDQPKPVQGWRYGTGFDAERKVEDRSVQDILDTFTSGQTVDMRLVLHACELARKYNLPLTVPSSITNDQNRFERLAVHPAITLISGNDAEEQLAQLQKIHEQYTITLEETNRDPQFIKTQQLAVRNQRKDQSSEEYIAQMAVRNSVDTVDVAPYFRSEGKLYIIAKLGIRPALLARDRMPHYISLSPTLSNIESISGAKAPTQDPTMQALDVLRKKIGDFAVQPQHIGSYFPSAGNNPEKTALVLCAMDPSHGEVAGWKEFDNIEAPLLAIEVDTLFQLYEKNTIKDPRLMLSANILKQQFAYANELDRPISTISQKDRDRFQEVLNTPLQTDRFYKFVASELQDPGVNKLHILFKKNSQRYRRVMSYVEEQLGGYFATQDNLLSDTDRHFFDAAVAAFAVPSLELAEKYQSYAAHDNGHYVQGTIIPTPAMQKETYVRLMSKTESLAVYDSDYRYPKEVGLDLFESTIGGNKSLARSFDNLGITDPNEVRQIVTQIEVDGIIPEKILRHPNYEAERGNIVYRVYRFHFMDKKHTEVQYDTWMKSQEIAKVMLRFGNCVGTEEEFEQRMATYEEKVAQQGEGVNTIKSHVIRVITRDLVLPALKIGLVLQMLHDNGFAVDHARVVALNQYLDELALYKRQIESIHATITGIEANEKNCKAVRDADSITARIKKLVDEFTESYMTYSELNLDQKTRLSNNTIPYFTGFVEIPHDELIQMIEEGERIQRAVL